tara:strand:+ start:60 stop:854 length:795 start_codon:yes stop_codon:yes gene_type:complete
MKKSQLRNIIRESIKELMNEQQTGTYHKWALLQPSGTWYSTIAPCGGPPSTSGTGHGGPQGNFEVICGNYTIQNNVNVGCSSASSQAFWQQMGSPQAGEVVGIHHQNNSGAWMFADCLSSTGCTKCWEYLGTTTTPPGAQNSIAWMYGTRTAYGSFSSCADCEAASPLGTTPPTSGCDPLAAFPPNFDLQSWTNTWTSLPNFSNTTNPNQPCNFVCQRRNQWTTQLAAGGMGPKQTNMVACRLAEAENQYQIHNCATSNANNCP